LLVLWYDYVIWHFSETITSVQLRVFVSSCSVCFSIQVVFYEGLKDLTDQGKKKFPQYGVNSSIEGLVLGGLAGGTLELDQL